MTVIFDLIVKGGTVVNHDGVGPRDIGVRGPASGEPVRFYDV